MFTKSTWAILGITPDSEAAFITTLNSIPAMYAFSQAFTMAAMRYDEKKTNMIGINPFENPRKDEAGKFLGKDFESAAPDTTAFGKGEEEFRLNPDMPWFGFWFIINEAEDVDDIKSKQEQLAYAEYSRPFKFLGKDQKKSVEEAAKPLNVGTRKQFPVLLDFKSGRAYIASTNKDEIASVRSTLEAMGVKVHGLMWSFGDDPNWVELFLNKINDKNKFSMAMASRADDIRKGLDIEPMNDSMKENIVKNYFALSELDSGQWAGLYPNTAIKLYGGGESVTVSNPSDAFNLLQLGDDSQEFSPTVYQSGVVFQELDLKVTKNGEKQIRINLFSFDLNQNWNLMEEGVALIRGFDIPNFKKDILKNIRKSKQEQPVSRYLHSHRQYQSDAKP
jgi:uncharacterized protein with GYD domain